MPCAVSLSEEFDQYKRDLMHLETVVHHLITQQSDMVLTTALTEIRQMLTELATFAPQDESSMAIHYMAQRCSRLIERSNKHYSQQVTA